VIEAIKEGITYGVLIAAVILVLIAGGSQ